MSKQRISTICCILIGFMCVAHLGIFLVMLHQKNKQHKKEIEEKDAQIVLLNDRVDELTTSLKAKTNESDARKSEIDSLFTKNLSMTIEIEELKEEVKELSKPEPEPVTLAEKREPQAPVKREEPKEVITEEPTTEEVTDEEATTEEVTTEEATAEAPESDDNGLQYTATYNVTDGHLTRSNGVVYYNGHKETWYSTNESAGATTAVSIPGKHVADDGTIRDKNGYVCVASSDHSFYTIVNTSVGPGKVYDCGCSHGTIDVYTTW